MADDVERAGEGQKVKRAASGHCSTFKQCSVSPHPAGRLIRELAPNSRADRVALFQHRTTWNTIRAWMRGQRRMPQWALDILDAKTARQSDMRAAIGPPSGKQGQALAAWRATRNIER